MKKSFLLIALLFLLLEPLSAQVSFERIQPQSPILSIIADFEEVENSSIAFADVDGNGSSDVLITGENSEDKSITILYLNDGEGNFRESTGSSFKGVQRSSVAFADVDGNGSLDVLISGIDDLDQITSTLYINDGTGNFTESIGTPFEGVLDGAIGFSDVDGNNTQDVLITGSGIAKLYANNGTGQFSEVAGTPFAGVIQGSVSFADVDGNNTEDVLITGGATKLYVNDGNGNFTEQMGTPFGGVSISDTDFADIDNNGTQDVLIAGDAGFGPSISLYANDGAGNFSLVTDAPFDAVRYSTVNFEDVDGNGSADVVISGDNVSAYITKLYVNDGAGNFSEVPDAPFRGVAGGSIAFADVDGNSSQDILITGLSTVAGTDSPVAKLYVNDGSGNFLEATNSPFKSGKLGSIAFSDVDGNNTQDVILSGRVDTNEIFTELYINDGTGNFTATSGPFTGIYNGSVVFADVDNNGSPDVLSSGLKNPIQRVTELYINNGSGVYTEKLGNSFQTVSRNSVAFADVNNNGNQDLLITGYNAATPSEAILYTNDGTGTFTEVESTPFTGLSDGSIAFSDIDANGSQDLLITGLDASLASRTKLYTNDGSGDFTEVVDIPFPRLTNSSIAFADVDSDGDSDMLLTGAPPIGTPIANLYLNDGMGAFTQVVGTPFPKVQYSSVAFADVDGNGSQDVLITGEEWLGSPIAKLYINDGSGSFTEVAGLEFEGIKNGSVAFADIDGNGTKDLALTGTNHAEEAVSYLYRNTTNHPPLVSEQVFSIDENNGVNNSVGTVVASDPENEELAFSIASGNESGAFSVEESSGILKIVNSSPLDFETNPVFTLNVDVTDGVLTSTETVTINLNDINEPPTITSEAFTIDENQEANATVATILATDPEDDNLTFSIADGNESGAFSIDEGTGLLTVANSTLFDFETNSAFTLSIEVNDGTFTSSKTISIDLNDINEPSTINSQVFTIDENSEENTSVGTIVATDPEDNALTFSITNGNESGAFSIDESTGLLKIANSIPVDFEINSVFTLSIEVNDGSLTSAETITVNLNDVNEPPTISSQVFDIDENSEENTLVGTIVATDPEDNAITFSITDGNESGAFSIEGNTGLLKIANSIPIDFEVNTVFTLDVEGNDGTLTSTETITIRLNDINESPTITSQVFTIEENSEKNTSVGTIIASDPEEGALTFSITDGNESGTFSIESNSGLLQIANSIPLDFETNPLFSIVVEVSDGDLKTSATMDIHLQDVTEEPPLGIAGNHQISIYPNPVTDYLFLDLGIATIDQVSVKIADLAGRIHLQTAMTQEKIDVGNLQSGLYFLTVTYPDHSIVSRFVKN